MEPTPRPAPEPAAAAYQEGIASWYGPGFEGRLTASGEVFDEDALTGAHRRLRFGTRVRVVNLDNGSEVIVRINDRGPFVEGRVIDVSRGAARVLGMIRAGIARVQLFIEGPGDRPDPR
jgi:rare lipoprotein A